MYGNICPILSTSFQDDFFLANADAEFLNDRYPIRSCNYNVCYSSFNVADFKCW